MVDSNFKKSIQLFLAKLSGYLRLDVRYFIKGGSWLLLSLFIVYPMGIIRSIGFANLAEQEVYGQFTFILAAANIANILTLPGINLALTETVARGNLGSLFQAAQIRFRWGLLASIGIIGIGVYYFFNGYSDLLFAFAIVALFKPVTVYFVVIVGYFKGLKRFDVSSIITIGMTIVNTCAILLALWLQLGLLSFVTIVSASGLVFYVCYYYKAKPQAMEKPTDPDMVAYGRSLTWAQIIPIIALYVDSIVLGLSLGFTDVAIYRIASILPQKTKNLMKMMLTLVMPKIAEKPDKRIYTRRTRYYLLVLVIANLIGVLAIVVLIPIIIPLLYSEMYLGSIQYAQLLMISLVFNLPNSFFNGALFARKQIQTIYRSNTFSSLLQLGLFAFLIPRLGILGIVISYIVSRWSKAFYQWQAVARL
ncbi:MAG: hypothetical protein B6242_11550 [Anaerolineaceae bacterium 4572_78]|nr:MAG: hypothetical protein B6242_11550 [Anaerolineaceae bacterium 4572_78]